MSRIKSRLKRLEKVVGERGACHCGRGGKPSSALYYPGESQAQPSDLCPDCGGKRVIIAVVYESPWPKHRTTEPFAQFSQPAGYE
jgi:hypothetical protein